ncbi:hypothetical protein [Tichowtungia aerotolerans]|uniref:Uncharacterized protein n=1 Tax=Tichowtungia aerotolerans TaxID=2697043 RepID=A0A6P1M6C4_9BACT|nr:hypothetical protein [Tichowtungia aerotolerans]QHI70130.1 hypothetical protein GT409_11975 [Tichowtungia aerotolerans]
MTGLPNGQLSKEKERTARQMRPGSARNGCRIEKGIAMTAIEADREIENIRELRKRVKTDPELAKRLLDRTGMYTPTGKLKKQFR